MKIATGSVGLLVLLSLSAGCCQLTSRFENRFGDFVDHVGVHEPVLDEWYHPGLDPLRIGKPDWCQCRFNRMLCPRACECYSYGSTCCGSACCEDHPCRHHQHGEVSGEETPSGEEPNVARFSESHSTTRSVVPQFDASPPTD